MTGIPAARPAASSWRHSSVTSSSRQMGGQPNTSRLCCSCSRYIFCTSIIKIAVVAVIGVLRRLHQAFHVYLYCAPERSAWPGQPIRRRAHSPPDAVPDKALGYGERVPAGTCDLGLLDAANVTVGCREGVPEVEVEMGRLAFVRPCRDPAILDVRRGQREAGHRARVDAGLL